MKRLLLICLLLLPAALMAQRAYETSDESEIIKLINEERAQRGMQPVVLDTRLTQAARLHTDLMVDKHELTHRFSDEATLKDRVAVTGIPFEIAGENVAYDANAQHAHVEFMHSPGHRANILNGKFNAVGIGVIRQGNLIWVTEDFAERMGVTSASEAATIVRKKYAVMRKAAGSPPAEERAVPKLGTIACQMAEKDHLDTVSARTLPNVRGVMAWTATDPGKLPTQIQQLAKDKMSKNYSVGICFASSTSNPNKVFWMVMAIY